MVKLRFGTAVTAIGLMTLVLAGACANGESGSLEGNDGTGDDSGSNTSSSSSSGRNGSSSSGVSSSSSGSGEGSSSSSSSGTGSSTSSGGTSSGGSSSGTTGSGSTSGGSSGSSASGSSSGSSAGSSGGSGSSSSGGSSSSSSSGSSSGCTSILCGSTGKACTSDSQCGLFDVCSSDPAFTSGELFPSGVCLTGTTCDPCGGTSPCDGNVHFCDGPGANDPTSPGVCVPTTNPPKRNNGSCLPACSFAANGSAPTGCVGKDVCNAFAFTESSPPTGLGYCLGGCTADSDCSGAAGGAEKCDKTSGLCLTKVTAPTKKLGDACTSADLGSSTTPAACNCFVGASGNGFCSTYCTVGGSECQAGWFCETEEPIMVTGSNDASVPGFSMPNQGLAGLCVPSCGEDAGACPTNSTCTTTYAGGPGCIPP